MEVMLSLCNCSTSLVPGLYCGQDANLKSRNCSIDITTPITVDKKIHTARIEIVDKIDVKVKHRVCKFQLKAGSGHRPKQKPQFRSMVN